ncbi:MAG: hypothetical protein ACI4D7_08390 [Lachnospiraceae bacterium]
MDFNERMEAKKVSEDEKFVVYKYGHLNNPKKMTGELKITNENAPSISTVKLEDGYSTRANEMRIGGKIVLTFMLSGVWPDTETLA